MQQMATPETVARAIQKLEAEGQKVTGRAVLAITGGSLGTVLQHIKAYRDGATQPAAAAKEIPESFQDAVLRLIGQVQAEAAQQLEDQINQAQASEAEALEGLSGAEKQIEGFIAELAQVKAQADLDRQTSEKTIAVATEKIEALEKTVADLRTERKQLIESGESARTELAKVQLHVERADAAAEKAEVRVQELEEKLERTQSEKIASDKALAVAEQKIEDLHAQSVANTTAALDKINDLGVQKDKLEERLTKAGEKLDRYQQRLDDLQNQLAKDQREKALAYQEVAGLKEKIEARDQELEKYQKQLDELQGRLAGEGKEKAAAQQEISTLKDKLEARDQEIRGLRK